jgi:hypothetical protein
MPLRTTTPLLALLLLMLAPGWAGAQPPMRPPAVPRLFLAPLPVQAPGLQCRQAIRSAESAAGLPDQLMAAIGHVESGRPDAQGVVHPWPWTINAEGEGHMYDTKAEAIAAVRALQARGVQSIDVGCMQVNLVFHPTAFASLDQAFDPVANANYAARFLTELYGQAHSWTQATAFYHSATPELGADYQRKVAAVLPVELRQPRDTGGGGNVWTSNVWTQNVWNSGPGAQPLTPAGAAPAKNSVFGQAGGGFMLSNRAENARVIAAPANMVGRGLADYRAAPIPVASRVVPRAPL